VQGADPVLGLLADPGADAVEFALQPGLERRDAVVIEQSELVQDLGDPAAGTDGRRQLAVADLVLTGVAGQHHNQALVDPLEELVRPATGLAEGTGSAASADDGGVVQVSMLAAVETPEVAAQVEWELELDPSPHRSLSGDCGGCGAQPPGSELAQPRPASDAVVVAVHAGEEQLLVTHLAQERLRDCGLPSRCGLIEGLQPT
jgi:hypothetical protein